MTTVLYRIARYEHWSGKYHFKGFVQSYEAMKRDAEEVHQRTTYSPNDMEWIVCAGTTPERLGASLDHWNASQLPTPVCSVRSFLMGDVLNESSVRTLEDVIWNNPYTTKQMEYNPGPEPGPITQHTYRWTAYGGWLEQSVIDGMRAGMEQLFPGKKNPEPAPKADPATIEVEQYPWTTEDKNRLEFARWLIKRGVISEECVV